MQKSKLETNKISIISYEDFEKVDLRSGTIIKAKNLRALQNRPINIRANFGSKLDVLQTSAQITIHYTPHFILYYRLRLIVGCGNLGEKNIAGFI